MLFFMIISALFVVSFTFGASVSARELPRMEDILVTSRQTGRSLGVTGAGTTVLTREDIAGMEISEIPELLETIAGINIIERGTPGSQADVSIRGSSVEGVLLLINGIRVFDPQTGHFTMDIPVALSSVERIEVMAGGGSSLYGSSASGGVINIITGKNPRNVNGGVSIGSFGSGKAAVSFSGEKAGTGISIALRGGRSDGYKPGSDLEYSGVNADGTYTASSLAVNWNLGFLDKRFGAQDFYAPTPSFEKTSTVQGGINARYVLSDRNMLRFRLGSRGHGDDFILYRDEPERYRNTHYNRAYSLAAEYLTEINKNLLIVMGTETERLGITSPALGNHTDYKHAVYGEMTASVPHSQISLSMRFDNNTREENIFSPGLGIVVPFGEKNSFRFRAEKSFRSPTYTELYYISPVNRGSPSLKSEQSLSMEAGVDMTKNRISAGLSGFTRKSTDVIDWIRYTGEKTWSAANHGRLLTTGMEFRCLISLASSWNIRFNTSILTQSVTERKGSESKYALNPVEKTFVAVLNGPLFPGLNGALYARYEETQKGRTRAPVAVKISRKVNRAKVVFSVSNIFNEQYEESPGLRAPGRWFNLGIEWAMGNG